MDTSSNYTWPPAYKLRVSKKARHTQIKIIPNQGLEIVVPLRLQKKIIVDELLMEKKSWIEKHLANLRIQPLEYITNLSLQAINQNWSIEYYPTLSKRIKATTKIDKDIYIMRLYGNLHDIKNTHHWLRNWLKKTAQQHLLPWLHSLSVEHGLPYNQAHVRAQQTLWGSCNSAKNINLNYKLLFLPANFVKHIMLHELCHTKHLNHSEKFWNLLAIKDANALAHNQAMRNASQYVPLCFNY